MLLPNRAATDPGLQQLGGPEAGRCSLLLPLLLRPARIAGASDERTSVGGPRMASW